MNDKYIWIVYMTINMKNSKLYIGVHKQITEEFDGYIGNGITSKRSKKLEHPKTPLQYAIKKYGYDSFKRVTIKVFDNEADAYKLEAELVDKAWLSRKDTYNATLGGKGGWSHRRLPVVKYSKDGLFLEEYDSVSDAVMHNARTGRSEINQSCKNIRRTSGGYHWRYKTGDSIPNKIQVGYRHNGKSKAVVQYDLSGNMLDEFPSIRKAAKETGANSSEIGRVARTGVGTSGGFVWRFKDVG